MLDKILAIGTSGPDFSPKLRDFIRSASKEKFVRGLGVMLILVALLLQAFAAISPTKTSAAPSPNDLIPGGVTSKRQLVQACENNTNKIDKILDYYGIKCVDIAKGMVVTLNSRDYNDRLMSAGHVAYGSQFPDETPVNISDQTIYWRPLHGWDTGSSSTYTALKLTNANGKIFWMLFTCGNLVHINVPQPYHPPQPTCPYNSTILASSPNCKPPPKPCPYNQAIPASSPACKPCTSAHNQVDVSACLIYHKAVTNLTENIANANGTTVKPGDKLKYTLTVTNSGKLKDTNLVVQDNISDILDYATLSDTGGGTLDKKSGLLSYPKVNIAAGTTVTKTFSVTVTTDTAVLARKPLADNPYGFDRHMTNVYGDTIDVQVPPPGGQVIVTGATNLPNTGPGTTMFVYALIAAVAGYFYSNRRLQLKEAKIALSLADSGQGEEQDE